MRQRKRAGQRLSVSANDWNSFLETAERVLSGNLNRRDNTLSIPRGNQDVLGKNTTGQTLPAFSVVGLSETVIPSPQVSLIEWKQQNHEFNCVIPEAPKHFGKWGITQEPLVANAVGRVRIAGIAIAHVTGTPPNDDWSPETFPYFVECTDNTTASLEIRYRGAAQVIWKSPDSDWAIIRFGTAWRPHAIRATLVDGNDFEQETAADPHTVGSILGIDDLWFGEDEIEVYNPLEIKLWQGCDIIAHWNATEEQWEVIAATSDKVVHGIQRNTTRCRFEKLDGANGWNDWDRNSNIPFIKDVFMEGCELVYNTACNDIIPITTMDFVKTVKVGSGANSCQLVYTTCETNCGECLWEATGTEPPFTWSKTNNCSGDCSCSEPPYPPESLNETATTRCSGGTGAPTEFPIMNLDWVTGVTISGCNLVVTKRCSESVVTSPLSNFVVAVGASPSALYYVQCNGTTVPIIEIGPCPPSDCGECTWEASGTTPPFTWVKTGDCATNDCSCDPPEQPPQSLNDTATTPCNQI